MSVPSQQKALFVVEKQGEWAVRDTDVSKPGPGEVLIRIESVALNPIDWKIQTYGFFVTEYPAILGTDSAGVVVELGEGVTELAVGDKVVHQGFFTNRLATFQQYTIAAANIVAKIPDNVTFDEAATIPVGMGAAWAGLYSKKVASGGAGLVAPWQEGGKGKYAGQSIVVFGGSGSVGQYALQFAKLSGFSNIITTASPRNKELVESLGATHLIDRSLSPEKIVEEIKRITSDPITVIFDAISDAITQNIAYDILSPGGTLALVLASKIDEAKLTSDKEVYDTFGSVHSGVSKELGLEIYGALPEYLKSGLIKSNRPEVVAGGLAGIPEGLERLKNNQVSGKKLVVHPQETQ